MIPLDSLQTGDLLLFEGKTWYDALVSLLGHSPYCHVAIVLKDPAFIKDSSGAPLEGYYTFESGYEKCQDIDGKVAMGIQVNRLEDVINNDMYKVIRVRHLQCERTDSFYGVLQSLYQQIHDEPYDFRIQDWLEAKFMVDSGNWTWTHSLWSWNDTRKTTTFWCSALVAYVYDQLGLVDDMNKTLPWSIIAPKEFSCQGNRFLKFTNCTLSDEITLWPAPALTTVPTSFLSSCMGRLPSLL